MIYAVIDSTGLVVNAVEWDGKAQWAPPEGHEAVPMANGGIGWVYVDGEFIPPPEPEPAPKPLPDPVPQTPEEKLAASDLTVDELRQLLGLGAT